MDNQCPYHAWKFPGYQHIDKFLIIQLLVTDYNSIMNIHINRNTMMSEATNTILGEMMHGGLIQKTTHDTLLTQALMVDYRKHKWWKSSLLRMDAYKFYDRIFPNISNIALRRIGVHPKISSVYTQTLNRMHHRVLTAYGVSRSYQYPRLDQIWSGSVQGNASEGPTWLALEIIMIKSMTIIYPINTITYPTHSYQFK